MGKKKGHRATDTNTSVESGPVMGGALAFWAGAVVSHGAAAHLVLGIDVAPSLLLLALVLALVGWTAGGGMVRAENFRQTKGIIGMAIACLLFVVGGTFHFSSRDAAPSTAEAEQERWVPPLPGLEDESSVAEQAVPSDSPGGPMGQSLFDMMGAASQTSPQTPQQPPADDEVDDAVLRARRYFYGWLHDDLPLMENESAASHVRELADLQRPDPPEEPISFDDIAVGEPSIRTNWIRVPVTGGGRSGTVVLGRSLGWEVVGIDVEE